MMLKSLILLTVFVGFSYGCWTFGHLCIKAMATELPSRTKFEFVMELYNQTDMSQTLNIKSRSYNDSSFSFLTMTEMTFTLINSTHLEVDGNINDVPTFEDVINVGEDYTYRIEYDQGFFFDGKRYTETPGIVVSYNITYVRDYYYIWAVSFFLKG